MIQLEMMAQVSQTAVAPQQEVPTTSEAKTKGSEKAWTPPIFSSIDPVVNEIAGLYEQFFDRSAFVEKEAKYLVSQFEQKHGDQELRALQNCANNIGSINSNMDVCKSVIDATQKMVSSTVPEMIARLQNALAKEQQYQEQRDRVRVTNQKHEQEELQRITEIEGHKRAAIEANFALRSEELRVKYQQVIVAPEPPAAPTNDASPATPSAAEVPAAGDNAAPSPPAATAEQGTTPPAEQAPATEKVATTEASKSDELSPSSEGGNVTDATAPAE